MEKERKEDWSSIIWILASEAVGICLLPFILVNFGILDGIVTRKAIILELLLASISIAIVILIKKLQYNKSEKKQLEQEINQHKVQIEEFLSAVPFAGLYEYVNSQPAKTEYIRQKNHYIGHKDGYREEMMEEPRLTDVNVIIRKEENGFIISDLGSLQRIKLNGMFLQKGHFYKINQGDQIDFGNMIYVFMQNMEERKG